MFKKNVVNLILEKGIKLSDDLIDYLSENNDKLEDFEKQLEKSFKTKIDIHGFLIGIYEKEANNYKNLKNKNFFNVNDVKLEKKVYTYNNYLKSHLHPVKHPDRDFFYADIFDNVEFRDDIASMEHPVFALKTGDKKTRRYEHNNNIIVVAPNNEYGMATIFDKDVLIYCISKLITAINEGKHISKSVRFTTYDFLVTTNRDIGGRQYKLLKDSMERLRGTSITTTISTGGITTEKGFGLIDNWEIIKEDSTGKMISLEVTLNEWLFRAINSNEVLKINPDYFRLRKPIDRRIYELARKHCGNQSKFEISLELLKKKTGSTSSIKLFRQSIKSLVNANELPDYSVQYDRATDNVTFISRYLVEQEST